METEDNVIKRLNEWKDFAENRGMRVKMNKTKVMISGKWHNVMPKAVRCHVVFVVDVLVIIQYNVLIVRSGYTGNVVV